MNIVAGKPNFISSLRTTTVRILIHPRCSPLRTIDPLVNFRDTHYSRTFRKTSGPLVKVTCTLTRNSNRTVKFTQFNYLSFRQIKMKEAEITQADIEVTRSMYIPVAVRGQLLFFCLSDLQHIDTMYQYSLEWFVEIFNHSIAATAKSSE